MTPDEERIEIVRRQTAGGFSNFQIIQGSGYQGYPYYACGKVYCSTKNAYEVKQALDRLEASKSAN